MTRLLKKSFGLLLTIAVVSFTACKKDEKATPSPGVPAVSTKLVKYEITGNFTGQVDIAYTNASGATESALNVTLPWTMEFTAGSNVNGVGFSANGSNGSAGQTVEAKLYTGGVVRQTTNGTANSNGLLSIGTLAYVF